MDNISLAPHTIPCLKEIQGYFKSCYKLSSNPQSFYISLIFSIFHSVSAHRHKPIGQKLYSTLSAHLSYNTEYFKYLQSLLNFFKSSELNSAIEQLENLIKTEGAISKLTVLSWAFANVLTGKSLKLEEFILFDYYLEFYEAICDKLDVCLAVFTPEKVNYVKAGHEKIMLWTFEENYSNLVLIVNENVDVKSFPLVFIGNFQDFNGFEVVFEELGGNGLDLSHFEKQVYFSQSHLGDYLALITAIFSALKMQQQSNQLVLSFYNNLQEILNKILDNENKEYFQYIQQYFWYFISNPDMGIEQCLGNKEQLVYMAQGLKMFGEKIKGKNFRFCEYLECFSQYLNLSIFVYQVPEMSYFNIENRGNLVNLYLIQEQNKYKCLFLKKVQMEKNHHEALEDGKVVDREVVNGQTADREVYYKSEPQELYNEESFEVLKDLSSAFIEIKKKFLTLKEIESIRSIIDLYSDYLLGNPILAIFNVKTCNYSQHSGIYFTLKCCHTQCIECLFYQIANSPQSCCNYCPKYITDEEKSIILKKGFKVNNIEYKNVNIEKVNQAKEASKEYPKEEFKKEVKTEPVKEIKCEKCNKLNDPENFNIIQCQNRCLVCVECRLIEQGRCSQCHSVYDEEKTIALHETENKRKNENKGKQNCDACKESFSINHFSELCKNCKICYPCSNKAEKCPNCFNNVNTITLICEGCAKGFSTKDSIEIICQYAHFFHNKCISKGRHCFKCNKTKKKNNKNSKNK